MALEELAKSLERYSLSSGIAEAIRKDPNLPQASDSLAAYISKYVRGQNGQAITPQDAMAMVSSEEFGPKRMRREVGAFEQEDLKNLIAKTKGNIEQIVTELPADALEAFALGLPEESKKYLHLDRALKQDDTETLRALLQEKYDIPLWQEYIASLGESGLKLWAQRYAHESKNDFVKKKLSVEKTEKDGKKKYVRDEVKMRAYVLKTLKSYKDEIAEQIYPQLVQLFFGAKNKKKNN